MLTVVTHTSGNRPELLKRCCESVERYLPPKAKHLVIKVTNDEWSRARMRALLDHELIAFVDDDDTVRADVFNRCLTALDHSGAGIAFTNEQIVDIHGKVLHRQTRPLVYSAVSLHPKTIHHLAVMRAVDDERALQLHQKFGIGIDWFLRVAALARGGSAIHVPVYGYNWTSHPGQATLAGHREFVTKLPAMTADILKTWQLPSGKISVFSSKV